MKKGITFMQGLISCKQYYLCAYACSMACQITNGTMWPFGIVKAFYIFKDGCFQVLKKSCMTFGLFSFLRYNTIFIPTFQSP